MTTTSVWRSRRRQLAILSTVTVRYWYTEDSTQPQTWVCDYAQIGCANLTARFVTLPTPRTGADTYLEVGFRTGLPGRSAHS